MVIQGVASSMFILVQEQVAKELTISAQVVPCEVKGRVILRLLMRTPRPQKDKGAFFMYRDNDIQITIFTKELSQLLQCQNAMLPGLDPLY